MPNRPYRLPYEAYIGRCVAYTLSVFDRKVVFTNIAAYEAMVRLLKRASSETECLVPIFCFMPDHAHILALPGHDGANTIDFINRFKSLSGIWLYNHGKLKWQPLCWDDVLGSGEDWHQQARYIAMNPVRARLVEGYSDYPYLGSLTGDVTDVFDGHE